MRTPNWRNYLAAVLALLRGAGGLALHGLLRPRTACTIERGTGRVGRVDAGEVRRVGTSGPGRVGTK